MNADRFGEHPHIVVQALGHHLKVAADPIFALPKVSGRYQAINAVRQPINAARQPINAA